MPVTFDNAQISSHQLPQTVERAFQVYGAWSNIHDFVFDDYYEADFLPAGALGGECAALVSHSVYRRICQSWRYLTQDGIEFLELPDHSQQPPASCD